MTSRKRKHSSIPSSSSSRLTRFASFASNRLGLRRSSRNKKRRNLLETLESRQLLAGPQLIGIQPNEGDLIDDGTIRNIAPRTLTFRFDEGQQIDPATYAGIRISRAGPDGQFDTPDDVTIVPGAVAPGRAGNNEVVVRFAESLPDDLYRIDVAGFDDTGRGIIGVRNLNGELLVPRQPGRTFERVEFDLRLGAQVEAVVPQPVVRLSDGSLQQRRNEILVYFNEDELFVENDPVTKKPTARSAENPRFYQLLLTQETVSTRDDNLYFPDRVIYDAASHTARLIFPGDDIHKLPGVPLSGGTFRLRIGTAVDNPGDFIIRPTDVDVIPRASSNLGARAELKFNFVSKNSSQRRIRFVDSGTGGLTARIEVGTGDVVYDFGGDVGVDAPTVQQLQAITQSTTAVATVIDVDFSYADVNGAGGTLKVSPELLIGAPPLVTAARPSGFPLVTNNLGVRPKLLEVNFTSKIFSESTGNRRIRFEDTGTGGLTARIDPATGDLIYDFGGIQPTVQDLQTVTQSTTAVNAVLTLDFSLGGAPGDGGTLLLPNSLVDSPPLVMAAAGDVLMTATDVGVFGQSSEISSLVISESISPQPFLIQLPGDSSDPGRIDSSINPNGAINPKFGPDSTDGVTEIEYNFQAVFAGSPATSAARNNINETQMRRVREALSLWANYLGVQFRETPNSGITFAVGVGDALEARPNSEIRVIDELDAELRIDPTFQNSAIVFQSEAAFNLDYGEDFFRKTMTGIGFLLGLEVNEEVTAQTLMALDPEFLNGSINPEFFVGPIDPFFSPRTSLQQTINPDIESQTIEDPIPNSIAGPEPIFPGNQDILHGSLVHRPDSVDIDLYRFEVSTEPGREFGTLTVESFAERLPDSSLLDTTLTLFQDRSAWATSDFGLGPDISVRVDSVLTGTLGNRSRLEFIQTQRTSGEPTGVRINRIIGENGLPLVNAVTVDIPRRSASQKQVTLDEIVNAINDDVFASTLFNASVVSGAGTTGVPAAVVDNLPILRLTGGGTVQLARNDDYFSSDSFLSARLTDGIYYVGVAASGNDTYDPTLPGSGFGGRTQGDYQLLVKFEPQVSQSDVIRDRDSERVGVPGTAIDGDLDGLPGGAHNFWFQTRSQNRILDFTSNGAGIASGQTMTVTAANGTFRRFEFVPIGSSAKPGNVPVFYNPGPGTPSPPSVIARELLNRINSVFNDLHVLASFVDARQEQLRLIGERSLEFSTNFRGIDALGRTLFVDKLGTVVSDGSLTQPFNNIDGQTQASAFDSALPGDIVRIVGNGGQDGDLATLADNFSYRIGLSEVGGTVLPDGRHMDVPQGVTVMIDAGAAFKLRSSTISVGSNNVLRDRSGGALQVLGTPRLVQLTDPSAIGTQPFDPGVEVISPTGDVVFTSTRDRTVDAAAAGNSSAPADGNWGGLIFQRDIDQSQGRADLEDEGIFLQVVNHADLRFGGGSNILINSVQQTVNPIQMIDMRPTVTFNRLTNNASAAMSASPNSFLETRYQEPRFQQANPFTADYDRVGPDIKQNLVTDNSINGLFIRTQTVPSQTPREITVAARFDDVDIVHYIAANVVIAGQPGGPIQDGVAPDFAGVSVQTSGGGSLAPGDYHYRMTFVDAAGFESLASDPTSTAMIAGTSGSVQLLNLPTLSSTSNYRSRRLYRFDPIDGQYKLLAQLNRSTLSFVDDGSVQTLGAILDLGRAGIRGRLDGSLVIDPNVVVKLRGARIELDQGTQLLAEGLQRQPVVFTSSLDDRFGAGGSFDTNDDSHMAGGGADPARGDWSGIYAGPTAHVSLDNAVVAYGGGVSLIESGQSRGFAALELQQASARVTNSRFEFNDNAMDGSGPSGRNGRLAITPATIYARGTEPVIVANQFVDNHGSIIDIDLGSMTDKLLEDVGRQTGDVSRLVGLDDNRGPLIRRNTTDSVAGDVEGERQLNGLRIRAGELTSSSVWDDTDIVHVLLESVVVGNQISGGALTLKSRPNESLVVKLLGRGTPNSDTGGVGFTATGSTAGIDDRIGGTIHVLGLPGAPVVLTSLLDDSVGAGRKLDGTAQTDTNGDSFGSRPDSNDWRSLFFDGLSNDRNLSVRYEQEPSDAALPGRNSSVINAQVIGDLAERLTASDDIERLGMEVRGFLSGPGDIDTYAFTAVAGTQVWIDLDDTSFDLDGVIEVLDDQGRVLVRSRNSFDEVDDPSLIQVNDPDLFVGALGNNINPMLQRWASGLYRDYGSTNPRDAGVKLTLPGGPGTRSTYFVRIRSNSFDPADAGGGLTSGAYTFQVRLQEEQEFPGSVVNHADIRYANHGIHVQGLPGSSPLVGEAQENESADPISQEGIDAIGYHPSLNPVAGGYGVDGVPRYPTDAYAINDQIDGGLYSPTGPTTFFPPVQLLPPVLNSRPQNLGDLIDSKTGTISVGGELSDISDIDFYQIDIGRDGQMSNFRTSTTFDIDYAAGFDRPDTNISVFYSPTANPTQARLVLFGEDSNVLDDMSSPLATELVGELLQRGSISESDPLIGPIALPAGSYFIAVTESGRVPLELTTNNLVRRSPIESSVRIFDDRIEVNGGNTAEPPREIGFVETKSSGWDVTLNRARERGHSRSTFIADDNIVATNDPVALGFQQHNHLYDSDGLLSGPSAGEPLDIALNFLRQNSSKLGLLPSDIDNLVVTDQYDTEHNGVTHIYMRQQYRGLDVINADININITDKGEVINVGNSFIAGLGMLTPSLTAPNQWDAENFQPVVGEPQDPGPPQPQISAVDALGFLADEFGLTLDGEPIVINPANGIAQKTVLGDSGISLDPIPAQLNYLPSPDGGVELAWNLVVATLDGAHWYDASVSAEDGELLYVVDWVDDASYNVFALPLENPDDGNRTIEVDPQDPVASPFGWHDIDGITGAEFTVTNGNNVSAQEDTNADNMGGLQPDGGAALNFDFPLNLGGDPSTYQEAAITNLFYWNNIAHDIHYHYGFDEPSGNFQENNYGNGGLGGDPVQADAQDGSGTNNANFATPPDGIPPRMQQYVFTLSTPFRDSDLSSSIIVHEFGHGVSNRLTGGPSNSGALNAIQSGGMGEGWGDFWGLMFGQKVTDGQGDAYPVGNYVLNQPPDGPGIRRFPYSFDMTINPLTYGDFNGGFPNNEVHNAGEIWASVLWDLNWYLINGDLGGPNPFPGKGFDPDLYNGNGGNNLALQLVMDGLKLQPANPSFLDARDAILAADQRDNGGANEIAIWTAFARRGMGLSADDGGSGFSTTVVEAFDLPQFPDPNNESIHFDRSEAVGTLTSKAFDLTGYSAADLPRFYFDYFVDAADNDVIDVRAWSNEQSTPVDLGVDLDDSSNFGAWRQGIASLGQFAGDTGVTIEFTYATDQTNTTAEGLYLDNFIVGFAERGEMVYGADTGSASFTTTSSGTPGRYQLEARPSTEYTRAVDGGLLVERALADNPNLIVPLWLSFQSGREIVPYDSFTIEVLNETSGLDETLTFQFQPTEVGLQNPSLVDPAAIPVPYSRSDDTAMVIRSVIGAINGLTGYAFIDANPSGVALVDSFDTNDRHDEQLTLIAPAADEITDGDRFTLGDGVQAVTFEFSTKPNVDFGNIRIPYTAGDSAAQIARRMIEVINSGVVQGVLRLRASTSSGAWDFNNAINPSPPPTDPRVALHGAAVGDFAPVTNVSQATVDRVDPASKFIVLSAIYHDGVGDRNKLRTQGEVIVENNRITEVHAVGIWSEAGPRGVDPEDNRTPEFTAPPLGNNFVRMPPVGNSQLGGVINFPELNDAVTGGLAPGLVARNNIVDQAGYTGIKVDGETRPLVIEWNDLEGIYASGNTVLDSAGDIMVPDGFIIAIDADNTRVVFEFEDVSGAPTVVGGSGVVGGDGFVDGHVPIYYRLGEGPTYNPSSPAPIRYVGHTEHEIMMAIYEAIQGSILVTNGLLELVHPTLGPSLTGYHSYFPDFPAFGACGPPPFQQNIDGVCVPRPASTDPNYLDFFNPAIYLEGATGIYASQAFQKNIGSGRTTMTSLNRLFEQFPPFGYGTIETVFDQVTGETSNTATPMMPIAEAPQPLAKIINNTVRGADGTEGAILLPDGTLSPAIGSPIDEPNDTITTAVDTKLEVSHRMGYFADGIIGDNSGPFTVDQDVDFYKVELAVGDRVIVDIDTVAGGPTAYLRLFDSDGQEVAVGQPGALPEYLNPGSSVTNPILDNLNPRDSFIDYTVLKKGTYYVGVSSMGNDQYESRTPLARTPGLGGTGDYSVAIDVLAPRSFVFSLDNHPIGPFNAEDYSGNINGTTADGGPAGAPSIVGATFTISQIPDWLIPTRPGDAYAGVNADGNRVTFEYSNAVNRIVLPNGHINIPILVDASIPIEGFRVPDIMRATANAINGYLNNPAIPNYEVGNGPDGRSGPVSRVEAWALGGSYGDNVGIDNLIRNNELFPYGIFGSVDFTTGFGHDRRESGGTNDVVPNGTFTDSRGTTELYVLIDNAAKIELSPEARAAGLKLGPDNWNLPVGELGNNGFATESDQLLVEQGIHISDGASASILNNVVVNAHQSLVKEETSVFGFGGRINELNPDLSIKPGTLVATGNAFQYDDYRNTQIRSDVSWWVGFGGTVNRNPALDGSISTDLRTGPSNIVGGNSDFNIVVRQEDTPGQSPGNFITLIGDDLLQDGAAGRFTPANDAAIIDSAVDALEGNVQLNTLLSQLGIPIFTVKSPQRDQSGQLRADEPQVAPPGGIGADLFKDRGALDLADFVGPAATLELPLDNDVNNLDRDSAVSFVRRDSGVFESFRILLQDLGDDSDPFVGSGIDNGTIVVSKIDGLRQPGANVVLFENDKMLQEGIDYTFAYDETAGVITLTPLAGIWRSDRAYRIELNNRDRTVVVAPDQAQVADGDQISIVDTNGGTVVFEFESGYSLLVPEPITLVVPQAGTNAGGLSDGDIFRIDDGTNPIVIFEFDSDNVLLPGTVRVPLPTRPVPGDAEALAEFLHEIATNIFDAIQDPKVIDEDGNETSLDLDVDPRLLADRVVVGAERGTVAAASGSGLLQPERTLALRVPLSGTGAGGISDGDTFIVSNSSSTTTFEFDDGGGLNNATNTIVSIAGLTSAANIAIAIRDAVATAGLGLNPSIAADMRTVFLNLPLGGSATVPQGQLNLVGLSRTPVDGNTTLALQVPQSGANPDAGGIIDGDTFIVINNGVSTTFEFDDGTGLNDPGNTPVPINDTGLTEAPKVAGAIRDAITASTLGLSPTIAQDGRTVLLNLASGGSADVLPRDDGTEGELNLVAFPTSGATIVISPAPTSTDLTPEPITFVINRTDETAVGSTTPFPYNADAATLQAALESWPNVNPGDVIVSGNGTINSGNLTITFTGNLANTGLTVLPGENNLEGNNSPRVNLVVIDEGVAGIKSEVLSLGVTGNPSGGNFTLELRVGDGVGAQSSAIDITRTTTANELTEQIAELIRGLNPPVNGLDPGQMEIIPGGLLVIGGQQGLGVKASGSSLEVTGTPGVTEASTIQVFGPLLLNLPLVGGGGVLDGSVLVLTDDLGNDVIFEFNLNNTAQSVTGAIPVFYDTFSTVDQVANSLVAAINTANIGITAQNLGISPTKPSPGSVSLGRIDQSRVNIDGIVDPIDPTQSVPGLAGVTLRRSIVTDGEVLTIGQRNVSVSFEFEAAIGGGGTAAGNIPVAFQPGSTIGDVAVSLAAAINNNKGGLIIQATAELDPITGEPTGQVLLDDRPGTIIDVSAAPTLQVTGVPGGAQPVRFNPSFSASDIKRSLLNAINAVNEPGELPATTLAGVDRGGSTLFLSDGVSFTGPIRTFFLPGIEDLSGNFLEENRDDRTTQFTILLPTIGLDFGDAPDATEGLSGRYGTRLASDGARHVVSSDLMLGTRVDFESDGQPSPLADSDDMLISISPVSTPADRLLDTSKTSSEVGVVDITVRSTVDPLTTDGETITITIGDRTATLEFDIDGIFAEENFAIAPLDLSSPEAIRATTPEAILKAVLESPLAPAGVTISGNTVHVYSDDEDGVKFGSDIDPSIAVNINPNKNFNKGVPTPVSVTVTGAGVLDAWIDFNADGDFNDPGEQIISSTMPNAIFSGGDRPETRVYEVTVPPFTPVSPVAARTYARFRLSRQGGLLPTGLSLSGEVEDHSVLIVPGLPPDIGNFQNRSYSVREGFQLQPLDSDGSLTTNANDDGILAGITDPDGQGVEVYAADVGTHSLTATDGSEAGELVLAQDGTFNFTPKEDFFGTTTFMAWVTDIDPLNPESQLISPTRLTITINVDPVNDPPQLKDGVTEVVTSKEINEDQVIIFGRDQLIDPFFTPGPDNESNQPLIIQSAGSSNGAFLTTENGTISIIDNGQTIVYTPFADRNGVVDTFTYVVADVPGSGQLVQAAPIEGTVSITLLAVNDPPRTQPVTFHGTEGEPVFMSIATVLKDAVGGPSDEDQNVTLQNGQFPLQTLQGGTVGFDPNDSTRLRYDPPSQFGGQDSFNYIVEDSDGAVATGTVTIDLDNVNNPPEFVGINGEQGRDTITRDEAKVQVEQEVYGLTTWFNDPDDDPLTFLVTSSDPAVVTATVVNDSLFLDYQPFAFGNVTLTVKATDPDGDSEEVSVFITVIPSPDPPKLIGTLDPLSGMEDQDVTADLSTVFEDPDGNDTLSYLVARLDNITNPSPAQISSHAFIQAITFVGDQLKIKLKGDQSGVADIEIAATDGDFRVSDSFTLTVAPVPDPPVAVADNYTVSIGGVLRKVNRAEGLLGNDYDPDGDNNLRVSLVSGPSLGTLMLNEADGTFTYTYPDNYLNGNVGDEVTFSYEVLDSTDRTSQTVDVTIELTQSRYQNPLANLKEDVSADGRVSTLDALRVINFLSRVQAGRPRVPVGEINSPPPNYYDVNGDGFVSTFDAKNVIDKIALNLNSNVSAESVHPATAQAAWGVTTNFAAPATVNLPISNREPTIDNDENEQQDSLDLLHAAGFVIEDSTAQRVADEVATEEKDPDTNHVDEALASLLDEPTLTSELG